MQIWASPCALQSHEISLRILFTKSSDLGLPRALQSHEMSLRILFIKSLDLLHHVFMKTPDLALPRLLQKKVAYVRKITGTSTPVYPYIYIYQ